MNIVSYTGLYGLMKGIGFEVGGSIYGDAPYLTRDTFDRGGRRMKEAKILASLAFNLRGRKLLELGTSEGDSAVILAKNVEPGVLWTVNLLPEQYTPDIRIVTHLPTKTQIGKVYREAGCTNVNQVYSSTQTWKPPVEANQFSLVFVDACHDAQYVFHDSLKFWSLLDKGGLMVWHDFCPSLRDNRHAYWINEVMTGVEMFIQEKGFFNNAIHNQADTWLGIMIKE